jgi:hypothetical protein
VSSDAGFPSSVVFMSARGVELGESFAVQIRGLKVEGSDLRVEG